MAVVAFPERQPKFKLTLKQQELNRLMASQSTHVMAFGGARSGKTFDIVRAMVWRATVPGSRHLITRFRFNACKQSILLDTLPNVMKKCWPKIPYRIDKSDWFVSLPGDSQIWIGGLDEQERTEKVLGTEYATIFLNECSQISWQSRNIVLTRLAQKCGLRLKAYYDCNPPSELHWTNQLFENGIDPESRAPLPNRADYVSIRINPEDNKENLDPAFIEQLKNLPWRLRRRFYEGLYSPADGNALWSLETLDKSRILDASNLPEMQRVVIGVDPSGSDDQELAENDAIGIVVAGLGIDGNAYILEDLTLKAGPATWGKVVGTAFDRHAADLVVGETNFGGAMVAHVIQTARPMIPFKGVTASRGKTVRAEPISALHETGKIKLVGYFPELEEELAGFTTIGYTGLGSPNRADAMVWAISELFPMLTRGEQKVIKPPLEMNVPMLGPQGWMAG